MVEILTAAQMQAQERNAIASGAVTGLGMMERAGQGVVDAVLAHWPDLAKSAFRAVVLCGPGNNGGDGFVIARLLHGWGWAVDLFFYGDAARLSEDARANHDRWRALGMIHRWDDAVVANAVSGEDVALCVDAVFGTGLVRGLRPTDLHETCQALSARVHIDGRPTVAVDIPSGLCADSGRVYSEVFAANLTVTFHSPKLGHYLSDGPAHCGTLRVAPIGLPPRSLPGAPGLVTAPSAQFNARKMSGHKFDHGHALILTGGAGRTGAARLAARGALRIGAGLVTLGTPGSGYQEVACQITALMLRRVEDADGLRAALGDPRLTALCLGPGLGVERATALLPAALEEVVPSDRARHIVLDADALTAMAATPEAFFARLSPRCVLTPHDGEFARLFPDIAARLRDTPARGPLYSRVEAARDAAARAGCHLLLKGPSTVLAGPEGQCRVHGAVYEYAAPQLATAGSGDVLAGFITGLLALGQMGVLQAMETAVFLHAACARRFGPGLIAEDLPEQLPAVLRDIASPEG